MELQQERIVKERKLKHSDVTDLQQIIIEEFDKIYMLASLTPGDRAFIGRAILYLLGRSNVHAFAFGLDAGYDWVDNARLYIITAAVYKLAEGDIDRARLERMVSYLRGRQYLAEEFDDALERFTNMRAANVLALA